MEEAVSGTPLLSPQVKTHQFAADMDEQKVELDIRPAKGAKASGKSGGTAVRKAKGTAAANDSLQALTRKRQSRSVQQEVKATGPWINV